MLLSYYIILFVMSKHNKIKAEAKWEEEKGKKSNSEAILSYPRVHTVVSGSSRNASQVQRTGFKTFPLSFLKRVVARKKYVEGKRKQDGEKKRWL